MHLRNGNHGELCFYPRLIHLSLGANLAYISFTDAATEAVCKNHAQHTLSLKFLGEHNLSLVPEAKTPLLL